LYGSGCGRRIDAEAVRQALHRAVSPSQKIERIHLALFEWVIFAEVVGAQGCSACATAEFGPGFADAERVIAVDGVAEIDSFTRAGGAAGSQGGRRGCHLPADVSSTHLPET
jgi:hypothetical protein